MRQFEDAELDAKTAQLQRRVENWARENELWYDCGFFDYVGRVRPVEWDKSGYVTVLAAEGPLSHVAICRDYVGVCEGERLSEEFDSILERHGFWYENYDHTEMWIYSSHQRFKRDYQDYMRWKWICSLIQPDFDILNHDLYAYFSEHQERLSDLHWRDFEKLVAGLMESQGYDVDIGPGTNDGGVDIRLLQRDPLGDILTLVQVKRYGPSRKVRLEAVQALHGAAVAEGANESMFVTTSNYYPSARRFAGRSNVPMELHASREVQEWCIQAHKGIVEDKRRLVGRESVVRALNDARRDRGRILHSRGGYGMVTNRFAIALKESRTSALLLDLESTITAHDGYEQRGVEVPNVDSVPALSRIGSERIRRAIVVDGSARQFRDDQGLYSPWDGFAAHFDRCD